jgi:hypothetical protein
MNIVLPAGRTLEKIVGSKRNKKSIVFKQPNRLQLFLTGTITHLELKWIKRTKIFPTWTGGGG